MDGEGFAAPDELGAAFTEALPAADSRSRWAAVGGSVPTFHGMDGERLPILTPPRSMGSSRDEAALSTLASQGRFRFSVRKYSWKADTSLIEARRRIVGALIQLGLFGLFAL